MTISSGITKLMCLGLMIQSTMIILNTAQFTSYSISSAQYYMIPYNNNEIFIKKKNIDAILNTKFL